MKLNDGTAVRPARDRERGQVFVVTACCMLGILAMSAWVVDIGNLFSSYQQLVAATQAAALAGADQMKRDYLAGKTSSTAFGVAAQYSAVADSLGMNARAGLQNVQMISEEWLQLGGCPTTPSTTAVFPDNLPCDNFVAGTPYDGVTTPATLSSSTSGGANGIVVGQQATVPLFFAQIFGLSSLTIRAYATAVPGRPAPFDMEVILDSTASMRDTDTAATCGYQQVQCAKLGVQALLISTAPCGGGTCSSITESPGYSGEPAYNAASPVEEIGLFTFEGLTNTATSYSTYAPYEYCGESGGGYTAIPAAPTGIGMYDGVPGATADAGPPAYPGQPYYPPTYEVVPLSSDFQSSPGKLSSTSNLVNAVGTAAWSNAGATVTAVPAGNPLGTTGTGGTFGSASTTCTGVQAIGGAGTFYAGIINQAQAALVANPRSNTLATCLTAPGGCAQNIIVLLSDGEANATNPAAGGEANVIGYPPNCETEPTSITSPACTATSATFPNVSMTAAQECYQAVQAAQGAWKAGTIFYAVAYGGETSGCSTDTTSGYSSPCDAMKAMAAPPGSSGNENYFFTDTLPTETGCTSTTHGVSGLATIFQQIAEELATGRLVPNGSQ